MRARLSVAKPAMTRLRYFLALGFFALPAEPPASAQYACTTNYCISSQSTSFQTPPGWPTVPVQTCCQTHWGALPGGIDWSSGAPIMICTGKPEFVATFPNCGDPNNLSLAFSLGLRATELRNRRRLAERERLPLRDAKRSDRRRVGRDLRRILEPSWSSDELVGVRTQGAQARILRVHGRGQLSKRRQGLLRGAQQLQTQAAVFPSTIAPQTNAGGRRSPQPRPLSRPRPQGAVVRSLYRETVDRHRAPGYAEARRVRAAQFDRIADDRCSRIMPAAPINR